MAWHTYERSYAVKKMLLAGVALAIASTSANAWTDRWGHWHEGPGFVAPYSPASPLYYPRYAPPPAYYPPSVYGGPVVVMPPPTDAEVIAGTILGIAGMFTRRGW